MKGSRAIQKIDRSIVRNEAYQKKSVSIRERQLEQLVLEELRDLLRYIPKHEKQFARVVMDRSAQEYKRETATKKRTAVKHRQKVEIIYNNTGAVDRLALKGLGA